MKEGRNKKKLQLQSSQFFSLLPTFAALDKAEQVLEGPHFERGQIRKFFDPND
jgi:hypothetical protein